MTTETIEATISDADPKDCQVLWLAVIQNAVQEATWRPARNGRGRAIQGTAPDDDVEFRRWYGRMKRVEKCEEVRDEARQWLTEDTTDFRRVCGLAGLDPAYVRRTVAQLQAKNWMI